MNPNITHTSHELPLPIPEGMDLGGAQKQEAAHSAATPERRASQSLPPAPVAQPPINAIAANPPSSVPLSTNVTNPTVADDNDLIEKEWVEKAKQIVATTKDDPYIQNKEMSRFKADYLKKRYNKDIKLDES
jgi:hypothetical protein